MSAHTITTCIISHLPTYFNHDSCSLRSSRPRFPVGVCCPCSYVCIAILGGDSRNFYQLNPPVSAAPTPSLPQNGPLYEFTRIGGTEAASTNERTNERTRSSDSTHSHTVSRSRSRSAQTGGYIPSDIDKDCPIPIQGGCYYCKTYYPPPLSYDNVTSENACECGDVRIELLSTRTKLVAHNSPSPVRCSGKPMHRGKQV